MQNIFLTLILIGSFIQLNSQLMTSGKISEGFIDLTIIDSTDYNHDEYELFLEVVKFGSVDKVIYFNDFYQITHELTKDSSEYWSYFDKNSKLNYKFFNSPLGNFYTIDSLFLTFSEDSIFFQATDSIANIIQQKRVAAPKDNHLGLRCDVVNMFDKEKNQEGYVLLYFTNNLNLKIIDDYLLYKINGFPVKTVIAMGNNLEANIGIKQIETLDYNHPIFTLPDLNNYVKISSDEFYDKM